MEELAPIPYLCGIGFVLSILFFIGYSDLLNMAFVRISTDYEDDEAMEDYERFSLRTFLSMVLALSFLIGLILTLPAVQ